MERPSDIPSTFRRRVAFRVESDAEVLYIVHDLMLVLKVCDGRHDNQSQFMKEGLGCVVTSTLSGNRKLMFPAPIPRVMAILPISLRLPLRALSGRISCKSHPLP